MSDDDEDRWTMQMSVDHVYVEVSGPDGDRVERKFNRAVEEAFSRYDEYVASEGGFP